MSNIIIMCDIIQKNSGFSRENPLIALILIARILEEGDIAPHAVCASVCIVIKVLHSYASC